MDIIDKNKPTRAEVIAHNTRIAKCNLACDLAGKLCQVKEWAVSKPEGLADFAMIVANRIIDSYPLDVPTQGVVN